ncbi:MAG: hypothetical protein RR636_02580 [Clostridium sp.]
MKYRLSRIFNPKTEKTVMLAPYMAEAQQVIFGPVEIGPGVRIAFIIKDDTIFELYEEK